MNTLNLLKLTAFATAMVMPANGQVPWQRPQLPDPAQVELRGPWGDAYARGLARIGRDPFTAPFVLADVNLGMKRWFTNYSGDISGRFLELAALTSSKEDPQPAALRAVMDQLPQYQRPDGHFGADVNWQQPVDFNPKDTEATMMPILWGNGRLLLGLVAAYERFGDDRMLQAARNLGGFYVNVVADRFCDPKRLDEYRRPSGYAGAYVTCVFQGMEGLVRLYRVTQEEPYLRTARRMADFHAAFDTLPVDHSHGSLSAHEALLLLFETTGDTQYLQRVTNRWDKAVQGGYINPAGGVLEKFWVTGYNRDEGCSEADWLRLNLMLWRDTGQPRYLDMAERLAWNAYLANQWPDGGFGHRFLGCDAQGPYAFLKPSEESLWCCSFHAPLALRDLKSYLAVSVRMHGIYYNFPVDFQTQVKVGGIPWTVTSKLLASESGVPLRCSLTLAGAAGKHVPLLVRVPEWADQVILKSGQQQLPVTWQNGYLRTGLLLSGTEVEVAYRAQPYLENRRLQRIPLPQPLPATVPNAVVHYGPQVWVNTRSGEIQDLPLQVDAQGVLQLPQPGAATALLPWYKLTEPGEPHAFVFNVRLTPAR